MGTLKRTCNDVSVRFYHSWITIAAVIVIIISITRGLLIVIYVFNYDGIIMTFLVENTWRHCESYEEVTSFQFNNFSIDRVCLLKQLPFDNQWAYKASDNLSWMNSSHHVSYWRKSAMKTRYQKREKVSKHKPAILWKMAGPKAKLGSGNRGNYVFFERRKAMTILNASTLAVECSVRFRSYVKLTCLVNSGPSLLTSWRYEDANTSLAAFRTSRLLYFAGC